MSLKISSLTPIHESGTEKLFNKKNDRCVDINCNHIMETSLKSLILDEEEVEGWGASDCFPAGLSLDKLIRSICRAMFFVIFLTN